MTVLERMQARRQARLEARRKIDEKVARGFDRELELEKGDLLAIVVAGLFNFVLPVMLAITATCAIAYGFFMRF